MSKTYLVKLNPLEPYTFASETAYGGKFETVSNSVETYFLGSKKIPEQTTIFGVVRYLVLKAGDALRTDFSYGEKQKEKVAELIGAESFSFEKVNQTFGCIESVSPLFLMNDGNILIKNPFCNKGKSDGNMDFTPFEMEEHNSSFGEHTHLPKKGEYVAKEYFKNGFVRVENDKMYPAPEDLFVTDIITGNAIGKETDGFFKREIVKLKEGYSFAVLVTLSNDTDLMKADQSVVYMGKRKNAFQVSIVLEEPDLLEKICLGIAKNCSEEQKKWNYAVSDIKLPDDYQFDDFAVVETKTIRNLETNYQAKNQKERLKRSDKQFNLFSAGSTFYGFNPNEKVDEKMLAHLQKIGLNHILKMGE